jgi:hypothetical protein
MTNEATSDGAEGEDVRKQIISHDMNNLIASAIKLQPRQLYTWTPLGPQYKVVRGIGRDISLQLSTKAETTNLNGPGITSQQ